MNVVVKVFDSVLDIILQMCLHDAQFGFPPRLLTELQFWI